MRRRLVEAVIFDWGGTLTTYGDVDVDDLWRHAAERLDPDRADELQLVLCDLERRSWERVQDDQASTTLASLLRQACKATGLDVRSAVLDEAASAHLDAWTPHISHDPDAVPLLAELRRRGYRTGLLSNTHWPRRWHQHFLDRDGLSAGLEATVYTSDLERTKPHPSAFKAVLAQLDVPDARYAVFVGDRLYDDVFGARQMGMRTILRRTSLAEELPAWLEPSEARPDADIDRLSEVVDLIEAWS